MPSSCFLTWTFATGLLVHICQKENVGRTSPNVDAICWPRLDATLDDFDLILNVLKIFSPTSCNIAEPTIVHDVGFV